MNKSELINAIAEKAALTRAQAEKAFNAYADIVQEQLAKGEEIAVAGFGTFTTASRAARTGRNPKTGKEIKIAAATVAKFRVGKNLKEAAAKAKSKK